MSRFNDLPARVELERKTDRLGQTYGLFFLPTNRATPFVVWLITERDGKESTYSGHYFSDIAAAAQYFSK